MWIACVQGSSMLIDIIILINYINIYNNDITYYKDKK